MKRAVFLDRDGVIVRDPPHYAHRLDQLKLIPGSASAIRLLNEYDFKVIVVSNQSGIGRGYYTEEDVISFNHVMNIMLEKEGAWIDDIYYCPHHPDTNCRCRKPGIGMLKRAEKKWTINLMQSFMIGDKQSDIEAGKRAGCKTILVETGHGAEELKNNKIECDFIAKDLFNAVDAFLLTNPKWKFNELLPNDEGNCGLGILLEKDNDA